MPILIQIFIVIFLLAFSFSLECGIKNCLECGKGQNSDRCVKCDESHFLYNHNLLCISCDDQYAGDVGCEKNCVFQNGFLECDENSCKEGYYNIDGSCFPCSYGSENCIECEYKIIPGRENEGKIFRCLKCNETNENVYLSETEGKCHKCNEKVSKDNWDGGCEICRRGDNKLICDYCEKGYFKTPFYTCTKCKRGYIPGGKCEIVCTDGVPNKNNSEKCECYNGYVQKKDDIECIYCGYNCKKCEFIEPNKTRCLECYYPYQLDQNAGDCYDPRNCSEGCDYCYYLDGISYCLNFTQGYCNCTYNYNYTYTYNYTKPVKCPEGCRYCSSPDTCDVCYDSYLLVDGKCIRCDNISEIGDDLCLYCKYLNEIPVCTQCKYPATLVNGTCVIKEKLFNCSEAYDYLRCKTCRTNNCSDYNFIYTKVTYHGDSIRCMVPEGVFQDCVEGTESKDGIQSCTKCYSNYPLVYDETLKIKTCNSKCNPGWFNKDKTCIRCSDSKNGNPGCVDDDGCTFYSANNQLKCNQCKDGYFKYEEGGCLECDSTCKTCHNEDKKGKCDSCIDNYFLKNDQCIEMTCQEYKSQVTSGCIICNNNYDYYMDAKKCEKCSEHFTKTEDETCVYCHARKNGGPMCNGCDNQSFKCKPENCVTSNMANAMNSKNQCFNCKNELGELCEQCKFENDILRCIKCNEENSILNEETGYCISKNSRYKKIPYCYKYTYEKISDDYVTKCEECKDGYYLNENGKCIELLLEKCTLKEINNNKIDGLKKSCEKLCGKNDYVIIDNAFDKEFNEHNEIYTCLSNSGADNNLSPKNLRKCYKAIYNITNNAYVCTECRNGFELDKETNLCKQVLNLKSELLPGLENCEYENKGNENEAFYSCRVCKNDLRLAEIENGAKICVDNKEIERCENFTTNTYYIKDQYNCLSCTSSLDALYPSSYLGRSICVSEEDEILNQTDLNYKLICNAENGKKNSGQCEDFYFSVGEISEKYCYSCNDENIGMLGCAGKCTFSNKRVNVIECESDKCKNGYLETSKGLCEKCDTVDEGCLECHYSETYPDNYIGIKRKRRFVCDKCDVGYLLTDINTCKHCSFFGHDNCKHCVYDSEHNNEFKCEECEDGYFLNDDGNCIKCEGPQIKSSKNNKCIDCDDTDEGGIQGCLKCINDNDEISCLACNDGFMLSSDNKCINKESDERLEKIANCMEVKKVMSKYKCTKCIDGYILLEENGNRMCVTPEFLIFTNEADKTRCQEAENIKVPSANSKYTAEDQPFYSCKKCIYNYDGKYYTLLKNKDSKNEGTCVDPSEYNELENCISATVEKKNDRDTYNCEECTEDSKLVYNEDTETTECKYKDSSKYCAVKYCKTCKRNNNYYCSVCALSDYEVSVAGTCIKKTKKSQAIVAKDMYRLELNRFKLRGLSASEIPSGHVFLLKMVYDYRQMSYSRNRNLQEKKEAEIYCTVTDNKDENLDNVKIVEYNCEVDAEDVNLTNYNILNMTSSSAFNKLKMSSFDEIVEKTDLDNLDKKTSTNFTFEELFKYVTFRIDDDCKIQKSTENEFNVVFRGSLNKDVEILNKNVELSLVEIDNEAMSCVFNTKEDRRAELNCHYNIKKHKNVKSLTFKTFDVHDENNPIYFAGIDEVELFRGTKKSNKKKIILYTSIACGVIIIGSSCLLLYFYLIKKRKSQPRQHKRDIKNVEVKDTEKEFAGEKPVIYEERIPQSNEKFKIKTKISVFNNYMKY